MSCRVVLCCVVLCCISFCTALGVLTLVVDKHRRMHIFMRSGCRCVFERKKERRGREGVRECVCRWLPFGDGSDITTSRNVGVKPQDSAQVSSSVRSASSLSTLAR